MTAFVIRHTRAIVLFGAMSLLAGCMYDPYTGTYYPCCANPYPHYTYPDYAPNYGYRPYASPYGYPPSGYPPSGYPPSGYPPYTPAPSPGYPAPPAATQPYGQADSALARRFAEANTTHDGRLTLQQAQAAQWQAVARDFPDIDVAQKGYVTLNEIRVWLETRRPPPAGTQR